VPHLALNFQLGQTGVTAPPLQARIDDPRAAYVRHAIPTTAVVSMVYTMEDGATAEMGLVGNEGAVGIALFMGGETTPNPGRSAGRRGALRMKAQMLLDEFQRGGPFQLALLRYTQALITQISQTAVCASRGRGAVASGRAANAPRSAASLVTSAFAAGHTPSARAGGAGTLPTTSAREGAAKRRARSWAPRPEVSPCEPR
jgi:hypothetical protein